MPSKRVTEQTVYQFAELSDHAKERARDWYREVSNDGNNDWSESVIEMAADVCKLLGIDLQTRPVKLMNGSTRYDPVIYWSGFSSQGDGASFAGRYSYRAGSVAAIIKEWPTSEPLQTIARTLQTLQRKHFYKLSADLTHRGNSVHEHSVSIDVECDHCAMTDDDTSPAIGDALRDVMRWIYKALEMEYEYQNSNEVVDENIEANEYEFDENGRRV